MTKHTRYRFIVFLLVWLFGFYFGVLFIERIIQEYLLKYDNYLQPAFWLFGFVRTVSILSIVLIALYLLYTAYQYLNSTFYKESGIPIHEAFYHGYFDLAYVYDRLQRYGKETTYDTKTRRVIIRYENDIYHIVVRDIFGRLEAEAKNDTWYIVSKRRKQYGNIRYMKRRAVPNPLIEVRDIIARMPKEDGVSIHPMACLTGLRRNSFQHDQINTVYEIEGILQHNLSHDPVKRSSPRTI